MLVPAGIYLFFHYGAPGERGWGIAMAIFIASLALEGYLLDAAKVGIIVGSFLSAIVGVIILVLLLPKPSQNSE